MCIRDRLTADARQTIPFKINLTYEGIQVYYSEDDTWLDYADKERTLVVSIGALEVFVKDQKDRPLEGATVVITDDIDTVESVTNPNGIFGFSGAVVGKEYTVIVRYGTAMEHQTVVAPGSVEFEVPAYDLVIRTVDGDGNPIKAGLTVNVSSIEKVFKASGEIALMQMPAGEIVITARYGRASQKNTFILDSDGTEEIEFDLDAPEISGERTEPADPGEVDVKVIAEVTDEGVGVEEVELIYVVNKGEEKVVEMTRSGGTYIANIPKQDAGKLVEYYVVATDKNGNKREGVLQSYLVRAGGVGDEPEEDEEEGFFGLDLGNLEGMLGNVVLLIAGGFVLLVVVVAAIVIIKRRSG